MFLLDMSQINRLVWIQVDHGVFYSSFKEGGVDGFMKFERGSTKKNAKTKHSVIVSKFELNFKFKI